MGVVERFGEYAAAFEKAYASDDWSLLEPFFTEDAVYETFASPPFGAKHEGRAAVLAGMQQSVTSLDRRFDSRAVELLEGPFQRNGGVWLRWRATYTLAGAPDVVLEGEETAEFDGDRIRRLEDRFTPDSTQSLAAWLEDHGNELGG